jgi:hypothetical protein
MPWRSMWKWRCSFTILDFSSSGSELASCPSRFTSGKVTASMHWIGSWVGPKASLDVVQKRNILSLLRFKACSPLLYWLSYCISANDDDDDDVIKYKFPVSYCGSNTEHPKILWNVHMALCTVPIAVNSMCKNCGRVFGYNLNTSVFVQFEVLTMILQSCIFWAIMLCSLLKDSDSKTAQHYNPENRTLHYLSF